MNPNDEPPEPNPLCGRCHRSFPAHQLRRLWRLPLFVLRVAHATPGDEGERLYCRGCARSQNTGVLVLAVMFSFVIAIGGHDKLLYAVLIGWGCGLIGWAVSYIVYRIRLARYHRDLARHEATEHE